MLQPQSMLTERKGDSSRRRWAMTVASLAMVYVFASSPLEQFESGELKRSLQSDGEKSIPNMLLLVLDQWRYDWDG